MERRNRQAQRKKLTNQIKVCDRKNKGGGQTKTGRKGGGRGLKGSAKGAIARGV